MAAHPPPSHLSAEARAWLDDPDPPAPMIDYSDPSAVTAQREIDHPEWEKASDELEGHWTAEPDTIDGVPVVRFSGSADASLTERLVVHVHGGGFVLGSPMANGAMAVPVAQRTGLTVVSIDYRLAPEHRCPAAVDDIVTVHRRLSADHEMVAMYGESAGANLALAATVALRDGGHPLPARLGLIAGVFDLTCGSDTYETLREIDPVLCAAGLPQAFARAYAGDDTADPVASPLFADLRGLPPILVQVGDRDILFGDSARLTRAVRRDGGKVVLDVWDGMWHVWQVMPRLPETVTAFDDLAGFLTDGETP